MKARKYLVCPVEQVVEELLQWGRADEGAEIPSVKALSPPDRSLQWGRADEGAEMT